MTLSQLNNLIAEQLLEGEQIPGSLGELDGGLERRRVLSLRGVRAVATAPAARTVGKK